MASLSIIICSRKGKLEESLQSNIQYTVGCEHEVIIIDNSNNKLSIFQAYNIGIGKSAGEILCFLHEDILIHTENWGKILQEIFDQHTETGLIGVAGSKVKTKMPSAWWDCPEELKAINIIQHFKEPGREKEKWYQGFGESLEVEAVAIDGVFMALKKNTGISFNIRMKGFHNYDLNLAVECARLDYKVMVTNRIVLEHFSIGSQDISWYKSTIEFDNLYGRYLPLTTGYSLKNFNLRKKEFENGIFFIKGLLKHNYKTQAIFYWLKLVALKPYSKFHLNFLRSLLLN